MIKKWEKLNKPVLNNMKKIVVILILLAIMPFRSYSQDISIISSPLIVKSEYNVKEKELTIVYTNPREFEVLIWVGDFYPGVILTWNDISDTYTWPALLFMNFTSSKRL